MKLELSHEVKRKLLEYCQFEKNHMLTVTEGLNNGDVVSVTKHLILYEYEVKTSRADLRNELAAVKYAMSLKSYQDDHISELFASARKKNSYSKIEKHRDIIFAKEYYEKQKNRPEWAISDWSLPNYFYFVVGRELAEYALTELKDTPYGLIVHNGCRNYRGKHWLFNNDTTHPNIEVEKDSYGRKFSYSCYFPEDDDERGCLVEVAVYKKPKKLHYNTVSMDSMKSSIKRMMTENIYNYQRLIGAEARIKSFEEK